MLNLVLIQKQETIGYIKKNNKNVEDRVNHPLHYTWLKGGENAVTIASNKLFKTKNELLKLL